MRQRINIQPTLVGLMAVASLLFTGPLASAEYLLNTPDGRLTPLKEGTFQPDLSPYQSKLPEVKILDRRFHFKHQDWAANEMFIGSQSGLSDIVRAAQPLAHNAAYIWLTNQQLYWGARNMLGFPFAASHAGINMVNGPYWTMKALELSDFSKLQRDRGERVMSNKDVMLQNYFPLYWKQIGIPRFPDDGSPSYLEFESGDPHFVAPTPVADTFEDPQSGKKGKWGVPEYFFNNRQWRWDRDGMNKVLDMGGLGIMLKRASQWVDYMWKSTHTGKSPSTAGDKKIILKGNDAEEGFRGMALATTRINQVLAFKSQLVADEKGNLGGINPKIYDPKNGLRYFPHQIKPNMLLAGDLPERQIAFDIDDPRSLLYDQGALLWGTTHLFQSTYRMTEMFTDNPPVDGGILEKSLGVVPHYLANMILKNIMAMHTKNGILVSEWQPSDTKWWLFTSYENPGSGNTVNLTDMTLVFLGAHEYMDRMRDPMALLETPGIEDLEPELTKKAEALITQNADFLLKVQAPDGSFCESYNVMTGASAGPCDLSRPNFMAMNGLIEVYKATGVSKYSEAARKTWNYLWKNYWNETHGVFRSRLGDDTVRVHALDIAAQLRAWREIGFSTPVHLTKPLFDKFPRWTVQTMMLSGMIQSEENRSGELALGVGSRDWDNDGVPWLGKGDGKFGITPSLAHEVAINIGATGQNEGFNQLEGQTHSAEMYGGDIRYGYHPKPQAQAVQEMLLPVKTNVPRDEEGELTEEAEEQGWVEREDLIRWDGIVHAMPPSRKFKRGSDLTGRQIFEMNCAHCHGYAGEGITGIPFDSDSLARTRDDMFEVPHNGRFTRLMPEWGLGMQDEMESTLTDEEIYRIVDYIQSTPFKRLFIETQNGIHYPTQPPRDPYFYISRSYVRGKQHAATEEDIALVMNAQMEAIKTGKKVDVMQRLLDADRGRAAKKSVAADFPVLGTIISWLTEDDAEETQTAQSKGWNPDDYKYVLGYTNEQQVYYASKPIEFYETMVADGEEPLGEDVDLEEAQVVPAAPDTEGAKDKLEVGVLSADETIQVAQSFDPDQFGKVLSYTNADIPKKKVILEESEDLESEEAEDETSQESEAQPEGEGSVKAEATAPTGAVE